MEIGLCTNEAGRGMAYRGDRTALMIGILISVAAHAMAAWVLDTYRIALPGPQAPGPIGPTEVVIFEDALLDTPPEVTLPRPSAPILRPDPPLVEPLTLTPPEVIPHDVPPRLLNGADVLAALEDGYPSDLPEAADQSRVLLWLFVDVGGRVTKIRLQTSSGFEGLDALALDVAPQMAYAPALNRGLPVGVWVAQRIRFQPPEGTASDRGSRS